MDLKSNCSRFLKIFIVCKIKKCERVLKLFKCYSILRFDVVILSLKNLDFFYIKY